MSRYADVTVAMKHAIKMDWSTQKWVSEVNLVNAINPNVVEVVRCKDCNHCVTVYNVTDEITGEPEHTCNLLNTEWGEEDGWCYMAEKRVNE